MKAVYRRVAPVLATVILAICVLAACEADEPRVEAVVTYSPGAPFATNFNDPDPRRQINCTITFEIVDETAAEELTLVNYRIRHAILSVLGELTMDEITTDRDLDAVAARIVDRVNAEVEATFGGHNGDYIDLVTRAYLTEFRIV